MKVDYLVVGAGFTGATLAERIASQLDKRVLVVERRDHIGGNAYDYYDEHGILVHKYGPHIFHTSDRRVWDYLSQFTAWRRYSHRVLAEIEGQRVPIPFNLNSLEQLFSDEHARRLERLLIDHFGFGAKVPILRLRETTDGELGALANFVYRSVFLGYNVKQWGLKPEELDASVSGRVPVRLSRDDRYFADRYQGIPLHGYTWMFQRMLRHPNISVLLGADFREIADDVRYGTLVYTGALDELLSYRYGPLPYRSLHFEWENHAVDAFQEVAQVNFPNEYAFTRITEFRHLTGQHAPTTTVAVEYPCKHVPGETTPYYPVPRGENRDLFDTYRAAAEDEFQAAVFAGRLADYKYYNMDQATARALRTFDGVLRNVRSEDSHA